MTLQVYGGEQFLFMATEAGYLNRCVNFEREVHECEQSLKGPLSADALLLAHRGGFCRQGQIPSRCSENDLLWK